MKNTGKITAALVFTGLLTAALGIPVGAAQADPIPSSATSTSYAPGCLNEIAALKGTASQGSLTTADCAVTSGISVGTPSTLTPKDAAAVTGLSSTDKASLLVAAAAGAVSSNHWSQFTTGAAYTRTQNGTFYYNGTRVWVTVTYDGYTGSHSCFTNYSVEFNLTGLQCNESGSTTSRSMYSLWEVNPNGTPIYYDVSMTAVLSKTGTISGYGATVG
jgi:hypothetical protein